MAVEQRGNRSSRDQTELGPMTAWDSAIGNNVPMSLINPGSDAS